MKTKCKPGPKLKRTTSPNSQANPMKPLLILRTHKLSETPISISLLITILPLFNLTKCLSSFTNISSMSSLPANDTESVKRRRTGEENSFSNIGIVRSLRRFFNWWKAKLEAQLSAGAMNSKELTKGN